MTPYTTDFDFEELKKQEHNTTTIQATYKTALSQLQNIQEATNPTNAQVINAIKQLAGIQEKILKYIYNNLI